MSRKIEIIKKYPALLSAIESFGYETTEQFWTAMNEYANQAISERDKFAMEFAEWKDKNFTRFADGTYLDMEQHETYKNNFNSGTEADWMTLSDVLDLFKQSHSKEKQG